MPEMKNSSRSFPDHENKRTAPMTIRDFTPEDYPALVAVHACLNKDPETVKYLADVIDQYLKCIEGLPGESTLRERGLELRQRVEEIGFHSATSLLAVEKNDEDELRKKFTEELPCCNMKKNSIL